MLALPLMGDSAGSDLTGATSDVATPSEVERLRAAIHAFVRSFGLLAANQTPCGKPIPVCGRARRLTLPALVPRPLRDAHRARPAPRTTRRPSRSAAIFAAPSTSS